MKVPVNVNRARQRKATNICEAHWYNALERPPAVNKLTSSAQYHRIAARRGSNRAATAVGHSILVIAYHLLKKRQPYHDLGANYFDKRKSAAVLNSAVKRIEALGYKVIVEEKIAS